MRVELRAELRIHQPQAGEPSFEERPMSNPQTIATDSAIELKDLIGQDATATFESDPSFIASNPTENASTENVTVQADEEEAHVDEWTACDCAVAAHIW
jgi:hypothetical protein